MNVDSLVSNEEREKRKYPRAAALEVARELCQVFKPVCEKLIVAGSLRRKKEKVGDVEILFVPSRRQMRDPADLFGRMIEQDAAAVAIEGLLQAGVLEMRPNVKGFPSWGTKNKLAIHTASGIPVDLFAATHENWWNLVVCRTGGMQSNIEVATAAQKQGWKWNPYGDGFSRPNPERNGWLLINPIGSEREVFEFVGLPFLPPEERR